ncbi:MAG: GGDEF domain-containing protein, partial [Desulfobulbaceae bacterium]|nr:GGDEF domain-containing protein [Desulfobulbaceae bacterium]
KAKHFREVLCLDDVFQREVTAELITWKKHFEIILDNMSEAFFEIIFPGRIIYLNARATSLFEMPEEEMLGASFTDFFSEDQQERVQSLLENARQTSHSSGEKKPIVINGKQVVLNLLPIPDNDHESIIVMIQDITNRKKMEEKLHRVSITDDLTGLLNRRGFVNMADKQFKIADRKKDDLFLIYADLDNLKKINDNNGHQAGDQALLETAKILNKTFRQSDIIGRLGGDEFAVLTTSDVDPGRIGACERFAEALKESNRINDFGFKLDLSVGIARYDSKNPCSLEEFISQADSLMYECKKKKKQSS